MRKIQISTLQNCKVIFQMGINFLIPGTPTEDASIIKEIKSNEKGEGIRRKQRTTRSPPFEILSSFF